MKRISLFFLLINSLLFAQVQEIHMENYFWPYDYNLPAEGIIGDRKSYVREKATVNSTLVDSLQIGNPIKILSQSEPNLTLKGLNLPWVEIEYQKGNILKKGFIWKGFIALGESFHENVHFVISLNAKVTKKIKVNDNGYKYEYDKTFYGFKINVCNLSNQIIATKTFEHAVSDNYYFTNSTIDNYGLKNVICVYRATFNGEACGVPTEYKYFYWDGKKLEFLLEKYNVGDAGAYYYLEEIIFPKEKGGKTNTIIKTINEEVNIGDSITSSKYEIKKSIIHYNWDGKKMKYLKTIKKKPYISNLE